MKPIFKKVPKNKAYWMIDLVFHWIYSEPGGGLVLKTETHWTKISGVVYNTKRGCYWFMFRRRHW